MNKLKMIGAAVAVAFAGGLSAQEAESAGFDYEPGGGITFNETPIVSAEFGVGIDSRYMTYGVIYGKDPIVVPGVTLTMFDWLYVGVESIFDVTKGNGKRFGYGNRAGKYTTIDAFVGLAHDFDLGETLGTLSVDVGYMYEYFTRYTDEDLASCVDDTQYVTAELSLGDLWLEPTLSFERDIMYDDGTYVNFEIGHTFELTESLTLRPAIGQGFGNSLRTKGYFTSDEEVFDHGGLMDTTIRLDLEYSITDWLTFGAYVAYYDYLFDDSMREAAADYNSNWGAGYDRTWNFVGGISVTATF